MSVTGSQFPITEFYLGSKSHQKQPKSIGISKNGEAYPQTPPPFKRASIKPDESTIIPYSYLPLYVIDPSCNWPNIRQFPSPNEFTAILTLHKLWQQCP